ncbi:MAG TPA: acyltransferase [Kiritimatiellia bacterium]|nr:acyltransferase [Kiritimatiellia bacterium]HMO98711.1 acyltransferase [Kiritimatiellia bacterium]HMP97853.1 acyltransferase [Kiritimatiellia bacterium]
MNDVPHIDQQIQKNLNQPNQPSWRQYARLAVGSEALGPFLRYEALTGLLGGFPGAFGLWLRRKSYPLLLGACGRGLIVGRNVTLRGASRIRIGKNVAIDDNVVIDARGADASIEIGDGVLISRNTIIRARNARISIGAGSDIGANCLLATDSRLEVGRDVLVAAYTYITAGGHHRYDDPETPIIRQGFISKGGVTIGDDVWIGSHGSILDGVTIGSGCVIGAHSLVNKSIDARGIAWGIPAVRRRERGAAAPEPS